MKHTAYLAFGSNLGEPQRQCKQALALLQQNTSVKLLRCSPWFRSPALTLKQEEQADYCNGVAAFATSLEAQAFFQFLKTTETKLGRPVIHQKWAPRVIDLDLLLFDKLVYRDETLTLPHPELTKRLFVLQPLCLIASELQDPLSGKNFTSFRDELLKKEKILDSWQQ